MREICGENSGVLRKSCGIYAENKKESWKHSPSILPARLTGPSWRRG
jgi:hypothetical protein